MNRREFIKTVGIGAVGLMSGGWTFNQKENVNMKIKAVKLYENGFMTQPFALGGKGETDKFDPNVKYRSTLQNFLIDTGDEVILVDTGMPLETPDAIPDEKTQIHLGTRIKDYVSALKDLGYEPDQVSKILVTHKHADHTGELRSFPKAKIYISRVEADDMKLEGDNIVRTDFTDGPYKNFERSQKIAEGVYYINAPGHTKGTAIIIAESDGLYYIIHGDVTYTDEALYADRLSVVFEDYDAALDTLARVRQFIRENPTVYVSTHTPLGYENLEAKKIVDLDNPPKPIPPGEIKFKEATGKYVCSVCGFTYDPAVGDPEHGIPAGTPFDKLPDDWKCPRCRQPKTAFNKA